MKKTVLVILLLGFAKMAWAVNADSLGGNPWTSFLRADIEDTVAGPLHLNQVNWQYNYAGPGKLMMQWDNYGFGLIGTNHSLDAPLINLINESHAQPMLEITADSNCPSLISLHGKESNPYTNDLLVLDQISVPNGIGLGVYNGHGSGGTGIYIDHGGDHYGMRIENNEWSTGWALWLDNCLSGTALEISDIYNGRIFRTSQDSANKPAITLVYRGSQSGYPDDSSTIYWWGVRGHKVEADTIKTAMCGLRTFGNGGLNLCDTIIVAGVAESTTVVTANYSGGFDAVTCTPLRIKVEPGKIIVKRGAVTDPGQYYWNATFMLGLGQYQGPTPPPTDSHSLGLKVFPNPFSGEITVNYAMSRPGQVELGIYNLLGQKVRTVVNQWQNVGYYTVQWDGRNDQGRKITAGVYLCRIKSLGCQETQKLVMVK